jgi:hypothetical protein
MTRKYSATYAEFRKSIFFRLFVISGQQLVKLSSQSEHIFSRTEGLKHQPQISASQMKKTI